jgi:hypothetical protein
MNNKSNLDNNSKTSGKNDTPNLTLMTASCASIAEPNQINNDYQRPSSFSRVSESENFIVTDSRRVSLSDNANPNQPTNTNNKPSKFNVTKLTHFDLNSAEIGKFFRQIFNSKECSLLQTYQKIGSIYNLFSTYLP